MTGRRASIRERLQRGGEPLRQPLHRLRLVQVGGILNLAADAAAAVHQPHHQVERRRARIHRQPRSVDAGERQRVLLRGIQRDRSPAPAAGGAGSRRTPAASTMRSKGTRRVVLRLRHRSAAPGAISSRTERPHPPASAAAPCWRKSRPPPPRPARRGSPPPSRSAGPSSPVARCSTAASAASSTENRLACSPAASARTRSDSPPARARTPRGSPRTTARRDGDGPPAPPARAARPPAHRATSPPRADPPPARAATPRSPAAAAADRADAHPAPRPARRRVRRARAAAPAWTRRREATWCSASASRCSSSAVRSSSARNGGSRIRSNPRAKNSASRLVRILPGDPQVFARRCGRGRHPARPPAPARHPPRGTPAAAPRAARRRAGSRRSRSAPRPAGRQPQAMGMVYAPPSGARRWMNHSRRCSHESGAAASVRAAEPAGGARRPCAAAPAACAWPRQPGDAVLDVRHPAGGWEGRGMGTAMALEIYSLAPDLQRHTTQSLHAGAGAVYVE